MPDDPLANFRTPVRVTTFAEASAILETLQAEIAQLKHLVSSLGDEHHDLEQKLDDLSAPD